jgi:hypothetical protein
VLQGSEKMWGAASHAVMAVAQQQGWPYGVLQGSEKMWGAASHAVMAVAQQQSWPYGSHRALKMAVRRMSEEYGDSALQSEFAAAEKFHANFYHGFMEDFELDEDRPLVRRFVVRVLGLLG